LFAARTEALHSVRWAKDGRGANGSGQNPISQNLTQQNINTAELRKCKMQTYNVGLPPNKRFV
jgi:hypothetical protein